MERDRTRKGEAIRRAVDIVTAAQRNDLDTMTELVNVTGATGIAGARPSVDAGGGEPIIVVESYGFAATPPGTAQALAISPGTDDENRVVLGLSAPAGRPATAAGDAAVWTSAGHSALFDDDGGITVTSKDGSVIEMPATGAINITAGTAASITLTVDPGSFVDAGGAGAATLVQAQALQTYLAAEFAAVVSPDPNIVAAFAALALSIAGGPPPSLVTAAATARARGL